MLTRTLIRISKLSRSNFLSSLSCNYQNPPTIHSLPIYSSQLHSYFSSTKENTPKPPPQMINTDEEFQEALNEIDLNDERVSQAFETDLQALSIKLLRASTSLEVLDVYEQALEKNPDLSGEELCMVLYFACYCKNDVTEDPRFHSLLKNLFEKIENASPLYLFALIHSLGIYSFDFGLVLPPTYQQKMGNVILKNLSHFELNQISAASWAAAQIISSEENSELREKVISELAGILLNKSESLTGLDYANILSTFSQCGIKKSETIDKFLASINKNLFKLETEDLNTITRLVMALGELNFKDTKIFEVIFTEVIRPQIPNYSVDDIATLILIYAEKMPDKQSFFREMVKNVHVNFKEINITSYLNIWLALAKLRILAVDLEKTLGMLKQVPWMNRIWSPKDLEGFEIINILIAMSTIKMNDKQFLKRLSGELESKLPDLENSDLVNLARAFTLYVKQDEDFYLKIHEECCNRINHLGTQDKNLLKETFTKAKAYVGNSPFVDVTLY